jgi:hypothetical protein
MYFLARWFLNMSGGSTVWSSTLISIMSSLFMAVSLSIESIGRAAPNSLGEPSPNAKITILKTIFSRSENQHPAVAAAGRRRLTRGYPAG